MPTLPVSNFLRFMVSFVSNIDCFRFKKGSWIYRRFEVRTEPSSKSDSPHLSPLCTFMFEELNLDMSKWVTSYSVGWGFGLGCELMRSGAW